MSESPRLVPGGSFPSYSNQSSPARVFISTRAAFAARGALLSVLSGMAVPDTRIAPRSVQATDGLEAAGIHLASSVGARRLLEMSKDSFEFRARGTARKWARWRSSGGGGDRAVIRANSLMNSRGLVEAAGVGLPQVANSRMISRSRYAQSARNDRNPWCRYKTGTGDPLPSVSFRNRP